jgi:copper transport protein
MRRRWWAGGVGLVLMAVAGWAAPASGHTELTGTEPASGSVVATSPALVALHFAENVEIRFGAVRVFNAGAQRVDTGNSYHPHGDSREVAMNLPANLPEGGYVVTWRVISADSHPVDGAFTFLVGSGGGAGTATATRAEAGRLLGAARGNATVGVAFGVIRFASFMSLFVLVGGEAFVAGAWPLGAADRRTRRLLVGALLSAALATVLAICIQGPYAGGLAVSRMVSPSVISTVLHTRFGQVYLVRLLLLVVAGPLLGLLLRPEGRPRWWLPAAAGTGAALLVTPGLAGHAGAGSLVALAIPFDLVHVAGAAVWVGGLAILAVAALAPREGPAGRSALTQVAPRFSQWALAAVVAIAVTGGFAAWRQVGSLSAVTTTPFGRLVLAKSIGFVVLVAVASTSRRLVHGNLALPFGLSRSRPPRLPRPVGPGAMTAPAAVGSGPPGLKRSRAQRQSALRRAVLIELALAAAVIGVTAVLVNAQPARQALNQPFSTEVRAGPTVVVDVVVDPARAGPVAIHLYTLSREGASVDVPEVTAALNLASAGVTNLMVPLMKGGPGHFLVAGFMVPLPGTWTLTITVRTTEFDAFSARPATVRIR